MQSFPTIKTDLAIHLLQHYSDRRLPITEPFLSSKLHELTVILSGIKRLESIGATFICPNEDSYVSVASP